MTADRAVVITGIGAISPFGDHPEGIFEALCEARRVFDAPTQFPAEVAPEVRVAEIRDFTPQRYLPTGNLRPLDRTGRLALVGVSLALADSGWTDELRASHPIGLVVGTMFGSVRTIAEFDRRAQQAGPEYASPLDFSNTVLNAAAGQVAIWQRLRGMNTTITAGATSGLQALAYGADQIRTGLVDTLIVGGVEEVCYESAFGFLQAGRLTTAPGRRGVVAPFDAARDGTALGEGAAFLVLEAEETARARGARIQGRLLGSASGFDPGGLATMTGVIRRALGEADVTASDIGLVESSASGMPTLDAIEASALAAVVGGAVPVGAIKSMTGETLGASGALQAIVALLALRNGRQPGIAGLEQVDPAIALNVSTSTRPVRGSRALVTSLAPEGNRCAVVLGLDR